MARLHDSTLTLARLMMVLGYNGATGVLVVRAGPNQASFDLVDGSVLGVVMFRDDGEILGDILQMLGVLKTAEQRNRLIQTPAVLATPIGQWLVDNAVVSKADVARALTEQARMRTRRVLLWAQSTCSFETASSAKPRPPLGMRFERGMGLCGLVFASMRGLSRHVTHSDIRNVLANQGLRIEKRALSILDDIDLLPAERALLPLLTRGASAPLLLTAAGQHGEAARALFLFKILGVATRHEAGSYRVLLRKRRQLSALAAPSCLLDIEPGCTAEEARRALRRLVREVHPDRFGAQTLPSMRRLSDRVTAGLVHAEARYRAANKTR